MDTPYVQVYSEQVEITPWKYARMAGVGVAVATLAIYLYFAQFAPAEDLAYAKRIVLRVLAALLAAGVVYGLWRVKVGTAAGQPRA